MDTASGWFVCGFLACLSLVLVTIGISVYAATRDDVGDIEYEDLD
jgi:hypothetical protein